jgi:oxygen-dependent protoporphyrinogen oxidase
MRVVVVGGGIAGLSAAHHLVAHGADVLLIEQSSWLGGKLRTVPLPSGQLVDAAAEAFAVRDPQTGEPSAAAELVAELGLTARLRTPAVSRAAIVDRAGALAPIPAGTLFGIPSDAPEEPGAKPLLGPGEDIAVGRLVRERLGDDTAERLVDPLLGGVYAGRADHLSLAMTIPALAEACRTSDSLTGAVRAVLAVRPVDNTPLFATLDGGLATLAATLHDRLGPDRIRAGHPVRALEPVPRANLTAWLVDGSIPADAVVLAVPARPAARLLSTVDSVAAERVGVLDYASVALVTLALPETPLPELSGILAPPYSRLLLKAGTFLDRKWPHLRRPGRTLVRVSMGRYGEETVLHRTDDELVAVAATELAALVGTPAAPIEAVVHRWGGALPQYAVGHLDRVAAVRAALPPTIALAGAAYDGVGIPACVRSGRAAAERVLSALEQLAP